MTLDKYEKKIGKLDFYKWEKRVSDPTFVYKVLGLTGEAGEVAEKFKKILRDKGGQMDEADRQEILKELGDVLWYLVTLARYLDSNLTEVANINMKKLTSRKVRGREKGSGDNR